MLSEEAKEARRRYEADYRAANRSHTRERQNRWQRENPDKVTASRERYWEKKAMEVPIQEPGQRCQHCNEPFEAKRKDAKFCSTKCRVANSRNK